METAVFVLGEHIFRPCLLPPAKLSAALPAFRRRGEAATGGLPARLPVPPPEVVGVLLLPQGSRRVAGNQIGHCWLFLVCARINPSAGLGLHGFCGFQKFAVPLDCKKCA